MEIPKHIVVKSIDDKPKAFLSPDTDDLKDCYIDTRLNGESKLEFYLPSTSEKIDEITPERQIWAGGRVYSFLKDEAVDKVMDDKGKLWMKFMAIERWSELDTEYPEPYITNDPNTPIPADLAVIIVGGGTNLSGGVYATGSAPHALYAVLQGSEWSIGTVDVPGIHDLEMEKKSRLQIIKEIQNIWGGYLVWDSVNKIVHLRNGDIWQNYTGFQVRYAKNLKNITRTQSNKLTTKLYCFGKDDLDIASVNDGKKYLVNTSYTTNEYVGIYSNPDITDADELMEKGAAELEINCKPRYNYEVKMVDLRTLPEYSHEDFSLGDMADILNSKLDIDDKVRLIRHKYNVFQPWKCELELGDPLERLIENLKASFNTTGFIDNTFDSSGYMSGGKLVDLSITYKQLGLASVTTQAIAPLAVDTGKLANLAVEAAKLANSSVTTTKIANAAVGSAAIAEAAIGTVHIGTGVIITAHIGDGQIVNAKIGDAAIDSAKIADAAITNAKINDLSVTTIKIGDYVITESKIANLAVTNSKIADLAITNAKIANATITTAKIEDLIVGTNVTMGPYATISWNNVTDQPSIPSQYTDSMALSAWIGSDYSTYIDSDGIYTGELAADQITAGKFSAITGMKLGTNTSTNKVFRLATEDGKDACIKAWTYSGPQLVLGYLDSTDSDSASLKTLESIILNTNELKSDTTNMQVTGDWDFSGANVTGLNSYIAGNGIDITNGVIDIDPSEIDGYGIIEDGNQNFAIDAGVVVTNETSSQDVSLNVYDSGSGYVLEVYVDGSYVGETAL